MWRKDNQEPGHKEKKGKRSVSPFLPDHAFAAAYFLFPALDGAFAGALDGALAAPFAAGLAGIMPAAELEFQIRSITTHCPLIWCQWAMYLPLSLIVGVP